MSLSTGQLVDDIQLLGESVPEHSFNIVAITTLLIWDILLTFDDEIRFIWTTKFSPVKVLFLVVRYLTLILLCGTVFIFFGNLDLCFGIIAFIIPVGVTITTCADVLLIQRVYAFYGRSRAVHWFFIVLFTLNVIVIVVILAITLPQYVIIRATFPPPFPPVLDSCITTHYPPTISYVWYPAIVFQSITFACIVARFVYTQYMAWKAGIRNSQIYKIFLRDGIWVFLILFLSFLLSAIFENKQSTKGLTFTLWSFTISSICSTRLILNLNASVNGDGSPRAVNSSFAKHGTSDIVINDVVIPIHSRR